MKKTLPEHLLPIVEAFCETGCQNVNEVIEKLEGDAHLEETVELSEQEKILVLNELKSVMSVYDNSD